MYFTRNLINLFSQYNGNSIDYMIPKGGILDLTSRTLKSHAVRGQINYNNVWEKHDFTIIGGGEIHQLNTESSSFRTYGYDENQISSSNVDYVTIFPTYNLIQDYQQIPNTLDFTDLTNRFVSVYGNAAYTYNRKYTLSGSLRNDGSNIFGVKTKNKWKPLWSAGVGWIISNEKFFNKNFVQNLNLRATYGYSGNTDLKSTAFTTIRHQSSSDNSTLNLPYSTIDRYANPELRWEKVRTLNFGIDFNLKNNRISGSIEYYNKKSTDVLAPERLDRTTGISLVTRNAASLRGNGIDITLNSRNIIGENFRWYTEFNFSHVKTKVVRYLLPLSQTAPYLFDGGIIAPIEGYEPFLIVLYKWAGLDPATGDPRGYLNKEISTDYAALASTPPFSESVVIKGPSVPRSFGNILNRFNWKGVELSANVTYRLSYYFIRPGFTYQDLFDRGIATNDYAKRWRQPGDEKFTNVPSLVYPASYDRDNFYSQSEVNAAKGDHFRLEDINLSYNFNTKKFKYFKSLKVYMNFRQLNIVLWKANHFGLDPNFPTGFKPEPAYSFGLSLNY
jgi:hypothetical protein